MATSLERGRVEAYIREAYCRHPLEYVRYRLGKSNHAEDTLIPLIKKAFDNIISKDATILDLGCGFDPTMASIPHGHYIGIDKSEALIKLHPLYGKPTAEFHKKDIRYCSFDRFAYDVVNGTLVLNYLRDPSRPLRRVRRRGKAFCFVLPNPLFDQKFGELNGHGVVSLLLNHFRFVYYSHSLDEVKAALARPHELNVVYSPESKERIPPFYVCLYGRW